MCFIADIGISIFPVQAVEKKPQDIIIFNNQKASRGKADMPPARFSHSIHNKKLKCKDCHPSVFKEKKGANIVTMKKNINGEYCGKCHNGQFVWDMSACRRCHV
ncbi:MAG: hypothetical protein HY096_13960 [Nitrospinae bacterium]|nr:hypothetical protein [Nitrospinota bacterium]